MSVDDLVPAQRDTSVWQSAGVHRHLGSVRSPASTYCALEEFGRVAVTSIRRRVRWVTSSRNGWRVLDGHVQAREQRSPDRPLEHGCDGRSRARTYGRRLCRASQRMDVDHLDSFMALWNDSRLSFYNNAGDVITSVRGHCSFRVGYCAHFSHTLSFSVSPLSILCRRARRLRRLTGNPMLKSQGELDAEQMTMRDVAMMTLVRPFILGFTEPIVASWNSYLALVYGAF